MDIKDNIQDNKVYTISILLATYNGETYLRKQLDSLLNQNFKDFRIIVADDSSTDDTRKILLEYKNKYKNSIELVFNNKSLGAKKNFIQLLSKYGKDSEYLMFCDQDDVWENNKISISLKTIKKLESSNKHPALVYTDLKICSKTLEISSNSMYKSLNLYKIDSFSKLLCENKITGNTIILNRNLANIATTLDIDYISENILMHDWYLGLLATYLGKIKFIDKALVLYRQHESNVLGVKKLNLAEVIERKKKAKKTYELMYKQARLIYEIARKNNIKSKNEYVLKNFISMQYKSRLEKIIVCIKNKFYKSGFLLSLSQIFSI